MLTLVCVNTVIDKLQKETLVGHFRCTIVDTGRPNGGIAVMNPYRDISYHGVITNDLLY